VTDRSYRGKVEPQSVGDRGEDVMGAPDAQVVPVGGGELSPGRVLRRRLMPLYVAVFLQNLALWVPIEKLFMTEIGFDPAGVGLMAAVYAGVVPLFEVPSGVLADRWSRRGVLVLASVAAIVSVVIGGLSQNVPTYMVAAVFLGIFFAMQSGTVESIVYDMVLEETRESAAFERTIGRMRLVESVALVASALAGGVIAQLVSLRVTYFLTAPLLVGACVALMVFREPRLHKAEEAEPLRRQLATTWRTLMQPGRLRLVIALTVLGAVLMQGMLEFGPLWLVALAVPAVLYGPHWAGLTAALGLGALLGGQAWLTRRLGALALGSMIVACCVVLALSDMVLVVIGAQVLLVTLVVAGGIPVMRRLHDAVPSAIRAGVVSGIGTLTWATFVPFALVIGFVSDRLSVFGAAWMLVAVATVAAVLLVVVLPSPLPVPAAAPGIALPEVTAPTFPAERFLPDDDPEWPGHWAAPPVAWEQAGMRADSAEALAEVAAAIREMPPELRQAILARDLHGTEADHALVHRARALIRARLERNLEGGTP
jgi:MFS family permease